MKRINSLILLAATTAVFSLSASAATFTDYAKVTKVRPVYKYVTVSQPVEQCRTVRKRSRRHGGAPTIVGAIIGGTIGHAIGNDDASTIAGAVIGGAIAHDSNHRGYRVVEECNVVYEKKRKVRELTGYNVKYRYKGESFKSFLRKHPGDKIKVRVKVSPAY